jgi:hypothetical protein
MSDYIHLTIINYANKLADFSNINQNFCRSMEIYFQEKKDILNIYHNIIL